MGCLGQSSMNSSIGPYRLSGRNEISPRDVRNAWMRAGKAITLMAFCWDEAESEEKKAVIEREFFRVSTYPETAVNIHNGHLAKTFTRWVTNCGYAIRDGGMFMGSDIDDCYDVVRAWTDQLHKDRKEERLLAPGTLSDLVEMVMLARNEHWHDGGASADAVEKSKDGQFEYLRSKGFMMP